MCGGAAIVWILKHMVQRIRPIGIISETGYSFPSGHALMASIFFPLVYYVFKYSISSRWYRGLFFWGNTILMIAIILSRPYIGVHYISDVVVGALIGLCITSFSILIVEGYYTKK
jgi:undecaprenyl-diphosphatase